MYSIAFHEERPHGTLDFPVEYHYIDKDHPRYIMPYHWHKEWELIRILKGRFLFRLDETEYQAGEGDIFLVPDGMLHGGVPHNCIYECLLFDLHGLFRDVSFVKKYLRPFYRNHFLPLVYYPFSGAGNAPELVTETREEALSADFSEIASVTARLMSVFYPENAALPLELSVLNGISGLYCLILKNGYYTENPRELAGGSQKLQDSSRKMIQIRQVFEYIENHYAAPVSLEMLANAAGMSPKYFCRFFRSITHQTPMEYVNSYRVGQAAGMLADPDLSITDISLNCGFNDSSYFVKVFKKYKGMTPGQYRSL